VAIDLLPSQDRPGMHWVTLHNASADPLRISVTLTSHDAEKSLQEVLTLQGGTDSVLGRDDGWQIEEGDTIIFSSPGFADRSMMVP
jgi:hypothetical protein